MSIHVCTYYFFFGTYISTIMVIHGDLNHYPCRIHNGELNLLSNT